MKLTSLEAWCRVLHKYRLENLSVFISKISTKLNVKNCIVWDYEWIKAGSHYRFNHEFIIYGFKKIKGIFSVSVWRERPINFTGEKWHQAEKPLNLIEKMVINSSKGGI